MMAVAGSGIGRAKKPRPYPVVVKFVANGVTTPAGETWSMRI
jgi:hypothetical protein